MATAAQIRGVMEHAYEAFNRHEFEEVRDSAAPGLTEHTAPDVFGSGFDAVKSYLEAFTAAFPDAEWHVLDIVTDERGGAARLRVTGTHRGPFMGLEPTGNRIDVVVADFLGFDDAARVTDHWAYMDRLEFMRQLDAIPAEMVTS